MDYDVIVIGGGPSGQSASVRLAQNGKKVAVAERDFIGGICVNWGCTPSKAMIESAKIAEHVREAGHYGVEVNDFQINFNRIAERRNEVVRAVREETEDLLRHHKIDIYQGEAIIEAVGNVTIKGGKLDIFSLGLAWYLTRYFHLRMDYRHIGHCRDSIRDNSDGLMMRLVFLLE